MTAPTVIGLDLSLRSTGVACLHGDGKGWTAMIKTTGQRDDTYDDRWQRIDSIARDIKDPIRSVDNLALVVIEGPAYGVPGGSTWDRAGVWWLVVDYCYRLSYPVAVAGPRTRAMYATGDGNATKADVVDATRKAFRWFDGKNDEADALQLAAMGRRYLDAPVDPDQPWQPACLAATAWPVQ
jgi:crossover junction endodeoxyribonuclease RuvC